MRALNWILQTNLINQNVVDTIRTALQLDNVSFEEIKIIPFSDELPSIKNQTDFNIFYGSTTLILNAYKDKKFSEGVFLDTGKFNIENYITKWGINMLNYDSEILTFEEFAKRKLDDNSIWFLRPVEDDKSFTGTTMKFYDIKHFNDELTQSNNPYLTVKTRISVSSKKIIEKEWRHFIVNKKIISSSRYLKNGQLDISTTDIPDELIEFVEKCCIEYVPHDIFVMDTAYCNGKYSIIECNCFNGTGFYKHDIVAIIRAVNSFLKLNKC